MAGKKISGNKNLRAKLLRGLDEIFSYFKATPTVQNAASAVILIPNANALLIGEPGTGKTTLIRMLSKAFFGGSFAKVSFSQSVTPFDVFFFLDLGKLSRGVEEITPRPILQARFRLFNELGRCPPAVQNELLELLEERQKTWRGQVFNAPEGINFFDMNPMDAASVELSDALLDRMDLSITVPALNMKQEFELLYETSSFSTDLVENTPKVLTPKQMLKIWEQVDAVEIPPSEMFFLTLLRAMISKCKYHDRSVVTADFVQQNCQQCTYSGEVCSQLKRVPAFRISRSAVKIAKALAYLRGSAQVSYDDVLRAFALALPHRIKLYPQVRNQFGSEYMWVRNRFFQAVETKQKLWKEAAGHFADALKGSNKAKEELKELGNRDVAVLSAYQSWFGGQDKDIFTKVIWQ